MSKKSTLDLLVRVRYSNPLPPPPYPPKLLDIPTDPRRYARVELTQNLANEGLLPMVVDAECGMPLDLCHFDSLWDGSTDMSDLNPTTGPPIDPRDMFMLEGVAGASSSTAGGSQPNGVNVSWLRKTEYLSRDTAMVKQASAAADAARDAAEVPVDTSLPAQIIAIEATFPPPDEPIDLGTLHHPTKPDITAVEAYEFLPDPDLWANTYDVFRFAERPGERSHEVPDPRLDCGILRPQESDGEHFLSYYVTKEDEDAEEYKTRRRQTREQLEDEQKTTAFHHTRDYETSKVEQDVANEFLLVLDDAAEASGSSGHDTRGAYYSIIQRKIMLRKKRAQKFDVPLQDKIDILQISHQPFTADEEAERAEALMVINDPAWIARAKEAAEAAETNDAEGEIDVESLPPPNGTTTNGRHKADDSDDMDED